MIDFRSDTVTRPSEKMMEAMMVAEVGDDVLGDDPSIIELEQYAANLFGKDAGLFCPSGTMANQIGIKVHSNAPGEVICSSMAHIYKYEGGGIAFNSGLSVQLIDTDNGQFTLDQVKSAINPDDVHFPTTQLLALENTCNKGGGSCWDLASINEIRDYCKSIKLPMHLDGARVFNAIAKGGHKPSEMGNAFDSLSICLSKGLGAPVGSILLGTKEFIKQGRRIRKIMGGGMRQAGYLAAAGLFALKNNIERLEQDHKHAQAIANELAKKEAVIDIKPVETNIVIAQLSDQCNMDELMKKFESNGIAIVAMGPGLIRFVTHLDISPSDVDKTLEIIRDMPI